MKHVLLFSLFSICILSVKSQSANVETSSLSPEYLSFVDSDNEGADKSSQPDPGYEKMLAVVFKSQEFCRAELKDFEFEARFRIVSATVYFSGTNFKNVETGFITGSSLKPIRSMMQRCAPGTMVIFDNVKVIGPDELLRSIPGTSYRLH